MLSARQINIKTPGIVLFLAVMAALLLGPFAAAQPPIDSENGSRNAELDDIPIAGLFDLSGPTSIIGRDYARGAADAVRYINAQGGVGGRPLRLLEMDHASMPERVLTYYKNFRDFHNGYLVLGWGVLSSSLLDRHVNRDHVVYMSADLNPKRADPAEAPYCFFIGATYEDQARLAMQWVKVNGGGKVVFIYPRIPFGECPIPGGKEQAERLGLTVGPDLYMDLRATDASSQVKRLKEIEADYAWVGGTSPATEALIKQAAAKGLSTRFIINSWGLDERAAKRLGEFALGRVYGFCPVRPFAWDAPALDWIKSVSDAENLTLHYNQAWASMLVLWEGLKRAAPEDLDGPGLKAALETLEGFETGGLAPPVTFTPRDHRSARVCGLYTIQQGRLKLVLDVGFDAEGLARARQAPSPAQAAAGVAGD